MHQWSQTNCILLQLSKWYLWCKQICLECLCTLIIIFIISLYPPVNMVMGVLFIFILSYICCLLIFFPLCMHKGGGHKVSVFNLFMHQCQVYVLYRLCALNSFWLLHDFYWVFLLYMAYVLLAEPDFHANFVLVYYIMGHMTLFNFSFLTWGSWALVH